MTRRLTILGSGTSFGVPVIGCDCEVCRSPDPRDRRTRVAAVVEWDEGQRILIDTPPEIRLQLVGAGVGRVDAVLYTHEHADHTHGIDDLRAMTGRDGALALYGPRTTMAEIRSRFRYIFDHAVAPPPGSTKPTLTAHDLEAGRPVTLAGVAVLPVAFEHGRLTVFGYRFGDAAYLTDVKAVPEEALASLAGVRLLVVNALFERPHPAHLSIPEAVEVARRVGADRTLLTHLTHRYRHADLAARLPPGIEPAYDGLVVPF